MTSSLRYNRLLLCGLLAAAAFWSCGDDPTGSGPPARFSLVARVTRPGGAPAAGIQVAIWNDLTVSALSAGRGTAAAGRTGTAAVSVIHFALPLKCRAAVKVLDYLSNPFGSPLVDTVLLPGYYSVAFATDTALPIAVLRCVLEARDTASNALFVRETRLMLLYQPDVQASKNGFTDLGGVYSTTNPLEVPSVLSLPVLIHTQDDPTPLGEISVLDSVIVVLNDTATGQRQMYRRKVDAGANEWSFVFSPATQAPPDAVTPAPGRGVRGQATRLDGIPVPDRFELAQNYPNPFN